MRSHPAAFRTGKSEVQPAERHFSLEMERQILEIQEAFELFIGDCERQKRDTENRLRETERQKKDIEDRLRAVERQKQAVEDQLRDAGLQLRKLQETLPARIIRCLRKSNLSRTARERIQ
jgi:N-glycosylase/DNA lyase